MGTHEVTHADSKKIEFRTPPQCDPVPIGAYVWAPFDSLFSVCSFERDDVAFGSAIVDSALTASNPNMKMIATKPKQPLAAAHSTVTQDLKYCFHRHDDDTSVTIGSSVIHRRLRSSCTHLSLAP